MACFYKSGGVLINLPQSNFTGMFVNVHKKMVPPQMFYTGLESKPSMLVV